MSEATMTEPATETPVPARFPTGKDEPEINSAPVSSAQVTGMQMSESAAPPDLYAVKMTAVEWKRQQAFMAEYIPAITQDREKADVLRRKLVFPSFILKALKKLRGADHIRKKGYNTIDADLVYGSGWMDEDDGGPLIKRGIEP